MILGVMVSTRAFEAFGLGSTPGGSTNLTDSLHSGIAPGSEPGYPRFES